MAKVVHLGNLHEPPKDRLALVFGLLFNANMDQVLYGPGEGWLGGVMLLEEHANPARTINRLLTLLTESIPPTNFWMPTALATANEWVKFYTAASNPFQRHLYEECPGFFQLLPVEDDMLSGKLRAIARQSTGNPVLPLVSLTAAERETLLNTSSWWNRYSEE